jgi:hypothetical protein
MSLPHAVSNRIQQALAMAGRFSHRPDNRVATRRLVFREAFPAALDIFELGAMATGRGEEHAAQWRDFASRAEKSRDSLEMEARAERDAAPPPRRRRRGGRGRSRSQRPA